MLWKNRGEMPYVDVLFHVYWDILLCPMLLFYFIFTGISCCRPLTSRYLTPLPWSSLITSQCCPQSTSFQWFPSTLRFYREPTGYRKTPNALGRPNSGWSFRGKNEFLSGRWRFSDGENLRSASILVRLLMRSMLKEKEIKLFGFSNEFLSKHQMLVGQNYPKSVKII